LFHGGITGVDQVNPLFGFQLTSQFFCQQPELGGTDYLIIRQSF